MVVRTSPNQKSRTSATVDINEGGQPDIVLPAPGPQGWGVATETEHVRRAVKYLQDRGLSPEIAHRAGIYPVANAKELHPGFKKKPALAIPYFDPGTNEPWTYTDDGTVHRYLRARYLTPEESNGFAREQKPQRFSQPAGSPVFAYFPAGGFVDWASILSNPDVPIVIVEGEIKGTCACAHGIPTIALGGVYIFHNDGGLLPEMERVQWQGRHTIICYDSDVVEKPQVEAAERQLASELKKRGATVHLARLPNADDRSKLGLDDFIARFGVERARELLLNARELSSFEVAIDIAPHKLLENLQQLDEAFATSEIPIFQRSGEVVHVSAAGNAIDPDGIHRAAFAPVIQQVSPAACQQRAMQAAKFMKWNERKRGPVHTACPYEFASHYIEKVDGWKLRRLQGIVEAPTIRADGTVIQTPGYDSPSGILYLPSGDFPVVQDCPSRDDAFAAYNKLRHVVRGFEFASREAESVWIASVMTATVRRSLRTAPLFAISAPVMGAGKTLAADLVSIIATGHEPAVMGAKRPRPRRI